MRRSAKEIVPWILELIHPQSVVDVGCGVGGWLATFKSFGVDEIIGVDGEYVDRDLLEIPADRFVAHDLLLPLDLARTFDLAVSLEVGEHLQPSSAMTFVESLTRLAPIVLFSAAIPGQGGAEHVNEQWPAYWAKLFSERRFVAVDCLRRRFWDNESVCYWYRQNMLLMVDIAFADQNAVLSRLVAEHGGQPLALVHPSAFARATATIESLSLRNRIRSLPRRLRQRFIGRS